MSGSSHRSPAPRRAIVTLLVVIASVFAFLGIIGSWVSQQVFDTDEWTKTSTALLEDEQISDAVAVYLVNELYTNVDVTAELQGALPPDLSALAAPLAGGLREFAQRAAERALEAPAVQAAWATANTAAHERFVDVIEDKGDAASTAGGVVTLDLQALVSNVSDRVGIGGKLAERLPPEAGQLEIMRADQLGVAQDLAKLINGLAVLFPFIWLAICGLAIFLSPGRRRLTVRAAAWGFIIAGVVALIARKFGGDVVVSSLADTSSAEPAVHNVFFIGTSLLAEIAQSVIVVGVLILIGAWLAGATRPATAFRRAVAPYMRERPGLVYGLVVALFVLLVLWAPARAFTRAVPLILMAILLLIGTEMLRRQTRDEFPGAPMPEGGIREAIAGWWQGVRT